MSLCQLLTPSLINKLPSTKNVLKMHNVLHKSVPSSFQHIMSRYTVIINDREKLKWDTWKVYSGRE
jgi:predicted oxidoreductase (fatty acid repression mutant protein)